MPGMYVYDIYVNGNWTCGGDLNTAPGGAQLFFEDNNNNITFHQLESNNNEIVDNVLSYTDNYYIEYYTSSDRENWILEDGNIDINYANSSIFNQPLTTNVRFDFYEGEAYPDDPGDDPGDDPSDEDTYYIAFFTEGNYYNFYDTNNRGFYLAPGEDNQIQVFKMDGEGTTAVYTLDYTDGYRIDYYFSNDFDTADPPASSWQFVTSYTDYNDVNSGAMASLGSGNIKLDFYDVVNPTRPDKTKIGGSSIRLKKIGNATVVKEVLNGVVIYTAE